MRMKITIADAIQSLAPGASWSYQDDDYSTLKWEDDPKNRPTWQEVEAEMQRLQAEQDATQYQVDRANAYPSIFEYMDGVVKGDQAQIDAYIQACLDVKAQFPKPEDQA